MAVSKPAKAKIGTAKQLLRFLAGSTDFSITYKEGGFRLSTFSGSNGGNNPDNGRSTLSYIVTLASAPINIKVELQGLTAQSTMEAACRWISRRRRHCMSPATVPTALAQGISR